MKLLILLEIDGLAQNSSNSSALAMELLQSWQAIVMFLF